MGLKLGYMFRETGSNLWRNAILTTAAVITIAVSLWVFGSQRLVSYGVANATERWEGGIEFVIWMQPEASPAEDEAVRSRLDQANGTEVDSYTYVNQQEAYDEFRQYYADSPELLETVTPENLPPSYRVVPSDPDADAVSAFGSIFQGLPGVRKVTFASEVIKEVQDQADRIQQILLIAGVILLVVSALLIFVLVIVTIDSRRREIEVMKLVGASNWFIRIPFMLEGLIHGLVGAAIAMPALWAVNKYVIEGFGTSDTLALLQGFSVTSGEFNFIMITVVVIGALVSVVASALAVSRHLDV